MTDGNDKAGMGGGIYLAMALVAGGAIGVGLKQPSLGVLGGLAVGIVAAIADYLWRRKA